MTEIPEHLLKRSKDRRAAGGGEAASTPATTTPATPATTAAAPAAKAEAPKPAAPVVKPDPPYVQAAKQRRKIPFWAMLPLSLLPLWAWMYVRSVQDHPEKVEGPRASGAEVYGSCAGCHGADGGGGAGRQMNAGEVLKTFPAIEDHLRWMQFGTEKYKTAGIEIYGNPNREGGVHKTGSFGIMPGWADQLTPYQILAVTCYVRYDIGGADEASEEWAAEYEKWCSPEAEQYALLKEGKTFGDMEFANVGTEPKEGRDSAYPAEG